MELSTTYENYAQYKEQFDACMKATANNFVAIGHLLIVARDTDILKESGYMTMGSFAKSEYGLDESTASRFIAICEKYGNGSDRLLPEYERHGYAKLAEMLTLPDNISEVITPEMTREEIREIKQEVKEEQAITPLEVSLEEREGSEEEHIETTMIKGYLEYRPAEFKKIFEIVSKDMPPETIYQGVADVLAPSGMGVLVQRISGLGKFMIKIEGIQNPVTFIDVRQGQNTVIDWEDFVNYVAWVFDDLSEFDRPIEEIYRAVYGTDMPEIEEEEEKRVKTEKTAKASDKTAKPSEKIAKTEEKTAKTEEKPAEAEPVAAEQVEKTEIAPAQVDNTEERSIITLYQDTLKLIDKLRTAFENKRWQEVIDGVDPIKWKASAMQNKDQAIIDNALDSLKEGTWQ